MNEENTQKMLDNFRNCPDYLYKYCSHETAHQMIENESIRFATRSHFNDPFDIAPVMSKMKEREILAYYDASPQSFKERGLSKSTWKKQLKNNGPTLIERISKVAIDNLNMFKITCLSENSNHILMWSHYADGHKGVCLQFKDIKQCLNVGKINMHYERVNYVPCDKRPTLKPLSRDHASIIETLSTKYDIWEYEQEWRIIAYSDTFPSSEAYIKMLKRFLTGCVFGIDMSEEDKVAFKQLCQIKGFDIKFKQARMHKTKYALVYDEIK